MYHLGSINLARFVIVYLVVGGRRSASITEVSKMESEITTLKRNLEVRIVVSHDFNQVFIKLSIIGNYVG